MGVEETSSAPECYFLEETSGIKFYALQKTLLISYDPKIKIVSIGKENDLDTKNVFLLGATGSGKTCLINALVNHILGVNFNDNYRYVLKDETDYVKIASESQTDYVVGYLIYSPPESGKSNNYLIIDSPGFKDSRGHQKEVEVNQQIRAFLQDLNGVDELHCIGFVVNGTIARISDQFRDIVQEFNEIFGDDAKGIIRMMISFGNMKRPPVIDVLESSCFRDYKQFKFDNGSLKAPNRFDEENSEAEITMSKLMWSETAKVFDYFLDDVNNANGVCLGMTRETLNTIQDLHATLDNLKEATESYMKMRLDIKLLVDEGKEYLSVMSANEKWEDTVQIEVKGRRKHGVGRRKHHFETRSIIHEDKKALYEDAKNKESLIQQKIVSLSAPVDEEKDKMSELVQRINEYHGQIQATSLNKDHYSTQELIDQSLVQLKMEHMQTTSESSSRQSHIMPVIEELQNFFSNFTSASTK